MTPSLKLKKALRAISAALAIVTLLCFCAGCSSKVGDYTVNTETVMKINGFKVTFDEYRCFYLKAKSELFIANRDAFKAAFPSENSYFYPIGASFFLDLGRVADVQQLKSCRTLLKSKVSVFSNFRSSAELSIVEIGRAHV